GPRQGVQATLPHVARRSGRGPVPGGRHEARYARRPARSAHERARARARDPGVAPRQGQDARVGARVPPSDDRRRGLGSWWRRLSHESRGDPRDEGPASPPARVRRDGLVTKVLLARWAYRVSTTAWTYHMDFFL